MNALDFPFATGSDQGAALFVAHWLAPIFDPPYAVDSRLIDGLWTHQLYTEPVDQAALRAQFAAAWQRQRDLEAAQYDAQIGADL
jgi:hypothetical protein